MNPEEKNSIPNPFAPSDTTSKTEADTSKSSSSANLGAAMSDNLASAKDSLTQAGLAADQGTSNAIGLDQIVATDPGVPNIPLVDEPLVPAEPVPGSIGSAISVPPVEPVSAPVYAEPTVLGTTPATETLKTETTVSEAPASVPYNPFASVPQPAPQPMSVPSVTPEAPSMPVSGAQPAPAPVPQPVAAPQPAPSAMSVGKPKMKFMGNPLMLILSALSVLLLITSVVFFILWNNEKQNIKLVYYPQISEGSNSTISSISCQRSESREDPAGSGRSTVELSYTGDDLSAFAYELSLDFVDAAGANLAYESSASTVNQMAEATAESFVVESVANDNNYTYNIVSRDDAEILASDALRVIYGTTDGELSLSLEDVQAKYEADGFVCVEE